MTKLYIFAIAGFVAAISAISAFAQDCRNIAPEIAFCGAPERWVATKPRTDNVVAQFRDAEGAIGLIQTDNIGTEGGMMPILLRAAILQSFGGAGPVNEISTEVSEMSGRTAERVAFSGRSGGAPFVAAGTYWIGEEKWVLALTLSPGRRLGKAEQVLHDEFVAQIRLEDPS